MGTGVALTATNPHLRANPQGAAQPPQPGAIQAHGHRVSERSDRFVASSQATTAPAAKAPALHAKALEKALDEVLTSCVQQGDWLSAYLFSDTPTLECLKTGQPPCPGMPIVGELDDLVKQLSDGPQWLMTGMSKDGCVFARDPLNPATLYVFPEGYFRKMRVEVEQTQRSSQGRHGGAEPEAVSNAASQPVHSTAELTQMQPYIECTIGPKGQVAATLHKSGAQTALLRTLPTKLHHNVPTVTLLRGTTVNEATFAKAIRDLATKGVVHHDGLALGIAPLREPAAITRAQALLAELPERKLQTPAAREAAAREILNACVSGHRDASFWTTDPKSAAMWAGANDDGCVLKTEVPSETLAQMSSASQLFIGREYSYDELGVIGAALLTFYLQASSTKVAKPRAVAQAPNLGGTMPFICNPD